MKGEKDSVNIILLWMCGETGTGNDVMRQERGMENDVVRQERGMMW